MNWFFWLFIAALVITPMIVNKKYENIAVKRLHCPDCGCVDYHHYGDRYECDECGRLFDEGDIKWQDIRSKISHYLIDTDEKHPIIFKPNNEAIIGENWPETVGLSTLEMYHCDRIFQVPGDGTIWIHIDGEYDPEDPVDGLKWHDIEEEGFLSTDDLNNILESLHWNH